MLSKNLKKVETTYFNRLPFFRSHQSFIININHILKYSDREVVLSGNQMATITSQKRKDLLLLLS
jgi:DNA-binding LytR/AlgR family response regulator